MTDGPAELTVHLERISLRGVDDVPRVDLELLEEQAMVLDDQVVTTPRVERRGGNDGAYLGRLDEVVNSIELGKLPLAEDGDPHARQVRVRLEMEPAGER